MYSEALLESLIQLIYEAAVGTTGWITFLVSLAAALDSGSPSIYFADVTGRKGSIEISLGVDEKLLRAYKDHYVHRNVWIQGAKPFLQPGIIRSSHLMCSKREFLRSEWYADFCKPVGWTQGLGATILQQGTMTSNIGVFTDNHRPPYGEADFALIRALMPHLQRGLRMYTHLAASEARGTAFEAVLNSLTTPVLLVTAEGKVIFLNAAAEQLIRTSDGLVLDASRLRAFRPDETRSLLTLVGGAAQTSGGEGHKSGGVMRISRPFGREPLEVLISPLPAQHDDWILSQHPVAAIFVTDRERVSLSEDSVLVRMYGLTATEAKVATALTRGLSGKEVCRELDISYNTLKTHLKHIYAKTRTKRHSDLVRVLAAGLRISRPEETNRQT